MTRRLADIDDFSKKLRKLMNWDDNSPLGTQARLGAIALDLLLKKIPIVDPVTHGHCKFIKYMRIVDGWYVVDHNTKCSECDSSLVNDDWKYCPHCGTKLDQEPQYFRQKTFFVEGVDELIEIPRNEYYRSDEWEYEI